MSTEAAADPIGQPTARSGVLLVGPSIHQVEAVFTYGVLLMLIMAAIAWYVLNHTAWGRHVYAVGDDPEAAQLSGVRVSRMLVAVYTLTGIICAIAGWALIGRIGSVSPQAGQFENINSTIFGGT